LVISLLKERLSLSGICRVCKISMGWLLWFLQALGKSLDYQAFIPQETTELTIELDELWTFVGDKKHQYWVWIALDRQSRMIIAFHVGKRDEESCQAFWQKIPAKLRNKALFYSDLWRAYQAVIPTNQHRPQEERGQTNHVERFNGTIRHLCSRLVRQNYAFSKKLENLVAHLNIIIEDYNKKIFIRSCQM
jgi:IS1 family transposase